MVSRSLPGYGGERAASVDSEPSAAERWIPFPIAVYAARYEVSDHGRVRRRGGPILTQTPDRYGYLRVRLSQPRAQPPVHRIVALAFVPNVEGKPCVNHLNHVRSSNAPSNLEWCTQAENLAHMTRAGRRATYWRGKRSPRAIASNSTVLAIRAERLSSGISFEKLGRMFGLSKRTVHRIVRLETYADV